MFLIVSFDRQSRRHAPRRASDLACSPADEQVEAIGWFTVEESGYVLAVSLDGPTPAAPGVLPRTGSDAGAMAKVALVTLATGSALVLFARRARPAA